MYIHFAYVVLVHKWSIGLVGARVYEQSAHSHALIDKYYSINDNYIIPIDEYKWTLH